MIGQGLPETHTHTLSQQTNKGFETISRTAILVKNRRYERSAWYYRKRHSGALTGSDSHTVS